MKNSIEIKFLNINNYKDISYLNKADIRLELILGLKGVGKTYLLDNYFNNISENNCLYIRRNTLSKPFTNANNNSIYIEYYTECKRLNKYSKIELQSSYFDKISSLISNHNIITDYPNNIDDMKKIIEYCSDNNIKLLIDDIYDDFLTNCVSCINTPCIITKTVYNETSNECRFILTNMENSNIPYYITFINFKLINTLLNS